MVDAIADGKPIYCSTAAKRQAHGSVIRVDLVVWQTQHVWKGAQNERESNRYLELINDHDTTAPKD